jgi:hypothetical protein
VFVTVLVTRVGLLKTVTPTVAVAVEPAILVVTVTSVDEMRVVDARAVVVTVASAVVVKVVGTRLVSVVAAGEEVGGGGAVEIASVSVLVAVGDRITGVTGGEDVATVVPLVEVEVGVSDTEAGGEQ